MFSDVCNERRFLAGCSQSQKGQTRTEAAEDAVQAISKSLLPDFLEAILGDNRNLAFNGFHQ